MKPNPTNSKPRIAKGHNPDKLTVKQVGKGWRLLTLKEVQSGRTDDARTCTHHIDMWQHDHWDNMWKGDSDQRTYRTRKPPGYFLPKKPKPSPQPVKRSKGACRMWASPGISLKNHHYVSTDKNPGDVPVLVLDLSPEARNSRRWLVEQTYLRCHDAEITDPWAIADLVLRSLGDTPADEGRGK